MVYSYRNHVTGIVERPVEAAAPFVEPVQPQLVDSYAAYDEESAPKTDPLKAAMTCVNEARRKLQIAESEQDESKATTELREALGEYFDRDMEFRQKELDEVKKGLQNLSDRLQKRADAKDEIVDLQLQLMVNEAEGLGFFSGSDASRTLLPFAVPSLKQVDGRTTNPAPSKTPGPALPAEPVD